MSPIATTCHRHRAIVPAGERCPRCASETAVRDHARRSQRNAALGRTSTHWRRLSFRMIRRHRASVGPVCPSCGRAEDADDPSTKLTLDLVRGGDHATATEDECEVKCRRCHGREQGARR